MIEAQGLQYGYSDGDRSVIGPIDVRFEHGELVLLTGPSGSGKSTFLRCLNGLIPHFYGGNLAGMVIVDGRSTVQSRPRDIAQSIGFVGQDPEAQSILATVEDDIAFGLENFGFGRPTMRKRVEEVMDALGITRLRDRTVATLSGGERQRVAIAGAMACMPNHLLLDEPTSQLDPHSAAEVLGAILYLRDELGISILISEHRLERVIQHADRLCLIQDGSAVIGEPSTMVSAWDVGPPISALGRALGWDPIPLGIRDARQRASDIQPSLPERATEAIGEEMMAIDGLDIRIDGHKILHDISLRVGQGEVVALMGRNGSGKSTLLRSMAGLARPHRGTVRATGSIALVPQDPDRILYRESVAAEISTTLKGRGLEHDERSVAREAARFGVDHLLARYPRDMSGGQKTRAAIAAAAAGGPKILLLDEPTRGMDQEGKQLLAQLVHQWCREGAAVVIATHDVELAALLASRVILMSGGRVIVDEHPSVALSDSVTFSTQVNKVFGIAGLLTVDQVLSGLGPS